MMPKAQLQYATLPVCAWSAGNNACVATGNSLIAQNNVTSAGYALAAKTYCAMLPVGICTAPCQVTSGGVLGSNNASLTKGQQCTFPVAKASLARTCPGSQAFIALSTAIECAGYADSTQCANSTRCAMDVHLNVCSPKYSSSAVSNPCSPAVGCCSSSEAYWRSDVYCPSLNASQCATAKDCFFMQGKCASATPDALGCASFFNQTACVGDSPNVTVSLSALGAIATTDPRTLYDTYSTMCSVTRRTWEATTVNCAMHPTGVGK